MSFIIYALLLFFLYNLVVKVIIPVYRTTRQVRRQFNQMKQQFQQPQGGNSQQNNSDNTTQTKANTVPKGKPKFGEYIDFEEVK